MLIAYARVSTQDQTLDLQADLSAFDAAPLSGTQVRLTWETAAELDLVGFNVYRGQGNASTVKLNDALLPAKQAGKTNGAAYEFLDESAVPDTSYGYHLKLVHATGPTSVSETIQVTTQRECANSAGAPALLAPKDGRKIKKQKVVFQWERDGCAERYQLVVRKRAAGGEVVFEKSGIRKTQARVKTLGSVDISIVGAFI